MTEKTSTIFDILILIFGSTAGSFFSGVLLQALGLKTWTFLFAVLYLILFLILFQIAVIAVSLLFGRSKFFLEAIKRFYLKK